LTYDDQTTTGNTAESHVACPGCGVSVANEIPAGCPDCFKKYGIGVMTAAIKEGDYLLMTISGSTIQFDSCWIMGDWLYLQDVEIQGTTEFEQLQVNISQIAFLGLLVDDDDDDEDPETEPKPDPEVGKKEDPPWQPWMGKATGLPQPPDLVAPKRSEALA